MPRPAAPFVPAITGNADLDQILTQVAQATNAKADSNANAIFMGIGLRSPDGTVWRVSVDDTGTLRTEAVPR